MKKLEGIQPRFRTDSNAVPTNRSNQANRYIRAAGTRRRTPTTPLVIRNAVVNTPIADMILRASCTGTSSVTRVAHHQHIAMTNNARSQRGAIRRIFRKLRANFTARVAARVYPVGRIRLPHSPTSPGQSSKGPRPFMLEAAIPKLNTNSEYSRKERWRVPRNSKKL